jgi:hypothetical protein
MKQRVAALAAAAAMVALAAAAAGTGQAQGRSSGSGGARSGARSGTELSVPLHWAQPEGRLVLNISVQVGHTFYESVTRIDLGSEINMMLPTADCAATGCSSSQCVNNGCKCAPPGLLMPASTCPNGGKPSGKAPAKNGRSYATCAAADVTVQLASVSPPLHLQAADLGPVFLMTSVSQCQESCAAKTGFNGHAPFPKAVSRVVGSSIFSLSQKNMALRFGAPVPTAPAVRTPWSGAGGGGRLVTIIAVNGVPVGRGPTPAPPSPPVPPAGHNCTAACAARADGCNCHCYCAVCAGVCGGGCYDKCAGDGGCKSSCAGPDTAAPIEPATTVAAIDSGNGAFLSYGPGSPLAAAKHFPFNITFSGGDTLVFASAPTVLGKPTRAVQYSHNVLALGFMARFDMTFDDEGHVVYFAEQ